ncbi:hypothetical protein K439DRAFT_1622744 [Ramaria rubella]|nr:hypothetical protein K439DRAFT_1622744 [Ramaria rubella]
MSLQPDASELHNDIGSNDNDNDSVSCNRSHKLPEDAPIITPDADFPDEDYIAPSIVALQSIMNRLIFNFAHNSKACYRAHSNWNILQRMKKDEINQLCTDISPSLSKADRMWECSEKALHLYHDIADEVGGEDILIP